jgi:hypothetical protein
MMSLVVAEESPTGPAGRIGLRYFSLYRLALATLFLILVWGRGLPAPLGTDHPALFGTVAHGLLRPRRAGADRAGDPRCP